MRLPLFCAAVVVLGCEPIAVRTDQPLSHPVLVDSNLIAPAVAQPSQLKVMTWNVKYGAARIDFWFDFWGDRVEMTPEEVAGNMENIYRLINEVKPDLLLTNEIEIGSRRSAYVDMVRGILENTDLNYAGYVPNWQSRYIPNEGLGRINMGNAIFSRYPITSVEAIPQVNRTDQDVVTDTFYLHRTIAHAIVDAGGTPLSVYALHTEAYDTDGTKSRQLEHILQLMQNETGTFLVGGDFNAIPPTSVKTTGFNDDNPATVGTEFESPPYRLEDMQPFFDQFENVISLTQYGTTEVEQSRYYTHSVIGPDTLEGANGVPGFWTRTLDYLFVETPSRWMPGTTDVLQQTGDSGITSNPVYLSDHAPVIGTWEFVR